MKILNIFFLFFCIHFSAFSQNLYIDFNIADTNNCNRIEPAYVDYLDNNGNTYQIAEVFYSFASGKKGQLYGYEPLEFTSTNREQQVVSMANLPTDIKTLDDLVTIISPIQLSADRRNYFDTKQIFIVEKNKPQIGEATITRVKMFIW